MIIRIQLPILRKNKIISKKLWLKNDIKIKGVSKIENNNWKQRNKQIAIKTPAIKYGYSEQYNFSIYSLEKLYIENPTKKKRIQKTTFQK